MKLKQIGIFDEMRASVCVSIGNGLDFAMIESSETRPAIAVYDPRSGEYLIIGDATKGKLESLIYCLERLKIHAAD